MATITSVPEWHPLHDGFQPFPVHAWLVHHPAGPVLFDAGVGFGNDVVDDWYAPAGVASVRDAVRRAGADPDGLAAVVLSHLHFDHCGQQGALAAPVYVQRAELEAARSPGYTVPDWAAVDGNRLRPVDGDEALADGVVVLATPGHTPGHQSLLVEDAGERIVLGGQCAFAIEELAAGEPAASNLHDPSWHEAACASIGRLRALAPVRAHLSHDERTLDLDRGWSAASPTG
ncbi:MAG TPA: MBL fold metallo-hydrolase [Acidimicrobiales bacterium]|nr:MBL fold metallo-hydrolase [Acidimicrobiales bacterium]